MACQDYRRALSWVHWIGAPTPGSSPRSWERFLTGAYWDGSRRMSLPIPNREAGCEPLPSMRFVIPPAHGTGPIGNGVRGDGSGSALQLIHPLKSGGAPPSNVPTRSSTHSRWMKTNARSSRFPGQFDPERLTAAVAQYMEWEAFTYWLRSLLEADAPFPETVTREVQLRCPGFLESDKELRSTLSPEGYIRRWKALLEWGEERFFAAPRREGWFKTVVYHARAHPRSARTVDYWVFHWDMYWSTQPLGTYPSFELWRQAADNYVVQLGNA